MKKLLLLGTLLAAISSQAAVLSFSTTTNGYYLISTNRASIYSIEISTPSANATGFTMQMFDCDNIAAPFYGTNYTNAAFVGRTTYATNLVSTFVGNNGYTNWYTNVGVYTLTSTNAASTNPLTPMAAFTVAAGTYAVYNADALFARGICITANTNASVVVYYRSAQ